MIPDIKSINAQFFVDYPISKFPEIEQDSIRPYLLLVFPLNSQLFLGVPFRTHMNHHNGYSFKNSQRSITNKSGLDFSKTLVIKDANYLAGTQVVDGDEYNEMVKNIQKIEQGLLKYVSTYINHH